MRKYSVDGAQATASPDDTILTITGGTTIRPGIYDGWIGSSATPADNALVWTIQRSTAAGTSTAVTPQAVDPGDPAATAAGGENHTAEPTYTSNAIMLLLPLNQRASHKLNLDPNSPIKIPASSNNGLGVFVTHSSFTGSCEATIWFFE